MRNFLSNRHLGVPGNQLVEAPASDGDYLIETLCYIEAYDEVLGDDYAFVAYKQTERRTGGWFVRIASRGVGGALFTPFEIAQQARVAAMQGRPHFSWSIKKEPNASNLRRIEFRVHVVDGRPAEVEICLQTLKVDLSTNEPRSVRFAWPARG